MASEIKNAIRVGIDAVEHDSYLDDEGIELMLEGGIALVPTLAVDYYLFKYGVSRVVPAYDIEKAKRAQESQIKGFSKAWNAGVDSWCGSITVSIEANFIILDENPINDILASKNVAQVYKDGKIVVLSEVEYIPPSPKLDKSSA